MEKMRKHMMQIDHSWESTVDEYTQVYFSSKEIKSNKGLLFVTIGKKIKINSNVDQYFQKAT
jgi:hypothetical protein